MTDLTVTLLPNGTAKPPGKAMALAFGYKGNRGIYGLNVAASGIWKGLTIRVCWHGPCQQSLRLDTGNRRTCGCSGSSDRQLWKRRLHL